MICVFKHKSYKLFVYFCEDSEDKKVHLITTLDNTEEDLLTLEYVKVNLLDHIYVSSFFVSRYMYKGCLSIIRMFHDSMILYIVKHPSKSLWQSFLGFGWVSAGGC